MSKQNNSTKVITGPDTRFSYVHAWEPVAIEGSSPKYSVSLLIPKSDTRTVERIRSAIKAAYDAGESKLRGSNGKIPSLDMIKQPLRDGDLERDDEAYKGHWFLNSNSTSQPGIVDGTCQPILDRGELYSGCYGRASITFYAYSNNGSKGIACGLNHLQVLRKGEPLGGRSSAEADFATDEDDEDFLT